MVFWGIKLLGNNQCWKISVLLIREKESQIQVLWNRKSSIERSDSG